MSASTSSSGRGRAKSRISQLKSRSGPGRAYFNIKYSHLAIHLHFHTDNPPDFPRPSINAIISKYSGEATGGNTGNEIEERGNTASRVEATLNVSSKDSPYALIDTYFPGIFSLVLCV